MIFSRVGVSRGYSYPFDSTSAGVSCISPMCAPGSNVQRTCASIPMHGGGDREMDGCSCSWKPGEAPRPFFLLERSPVTNDFILGRWDC